jgi:hypothetical protein
MSIDLPAKIPTLAILGAREFKLILMIAHHLITTGEPSSMSRNQPDYYMPSDFFSRHTLEQTCCLLKKEHPALAHCIQNALQHLRIVPYENLHRVYTGEMLSNIDLVDHIKPHVVGRVVSCLTDIGQKVLSNKQTPQNDMVSLRGIIEDWMQLTEWILLRTNADKQDCTPYQ